MEGGHSRGWLLNVHDWMNLTISETLEERKTSRVFESASTDEAEEEVRLSRDGEETLIDHIP